MLYICNCGRTKSGQPYHSSAKKRWLCEACKALSKEERIQVDKVVKLTIERFCSLSLTCSRAGSGKQRRLKISGE